MTQTSAPPPTTPDVGDAPRSPAPGLLGRISRLEVLTATLIAAIMAVLVVIEPSILEAPFENGRTLLFTVGGTVAAALALLLMLQLRVPAPVRVIVLVVPFVIVNWWLLSPYFVDDVVDEEFSTSISAQLDETPATPDPTTAPDDTAGASPSSTPTVAETPAETSGPVLLGAGQFVGLAGHSGTGDAGVFEKPDGSLVLRFENFDIENGPDLEVYLVPGADQTSLGEGSIALGALEGNVGDQTYELPAGTRLAPGPYTALVWCEAFSVEFVGATIDV
jgi:hypothetical protein